MLRLDFKVTGVLAKGYPTILAKAKGNALRGIVRCSFGDP